MGNALETAKLRLPRSLSAGIERMGEKVVLFFKKPKRSPKSKHALLVSATG